MKGEGYGRGCLAARQKRQPKIHDGSPVCPPPNLTLIQAAQVEHRKRQKEELKEEEERAILLAKEAEVKAFAAAQAKAAKTRAAEEKTKQEVAHRVVLEAKLTKRRGTVAMLGAATPAPPTASASNSGLQHENG
mmetsp:Transcript_18213/g.36753  ORF Transcript_18213/g.36753 Transcript_18213/m.36753 type:complete len:134 (+) Transcript_18213:677-1078(+)